MDDTMEILEELCHTVKGEMKSANEKIRNAGGKLATGDLDIIDKLTHALKSIKGTMAMIESSEYGHYSQAYGYPSMPSMPYYRGSYAGTNGMRRGSYASGVDEVIEDLMTMIPTLPEEKRRKVEKLVSELRK